MYVRYEYGAALNLEEHTEGRMKMNNAGDGDVIAVVVGHVKIDVRMISALASNRYCAVDAVRWRFLTMPLRIVRKRVAWLGTQVVVENLASFRLVWVL